MTIVRLSISQASLYSTLHHPTLLPVLYGDGFSELECASTGCDVHKRLSALRLARRPHRTVLSSGNPLDFP